MITKSSDRVAFAEVAGTGNATVLKRMTNFTEMSTNKNPKEYTRQYVDETFERSDIAGYSPSISYSFDYDNTNDVHKHIVNISDNELVGDEAKMSIVVVELDNETSTAGSFVAKKRDFYVIPDSEGGDKDFYTYGGNFKANGGIIEGTATTTDGWQTAVFTPATTE